MRGEGKISLHLFYKYGTGGLAYVLTLIEYMHGIGQNHSPNIAMAWLRADYSLQPGAFNFGCFVWVSLLLL